MWIPRTTQEIEDAATRGELEETPSFDAKEALPQTSKNADLAEDVAAMACDGGVLLYGVGEDSAKRPTIPRPIELSGARERVDQIVQTSIAEPPYIEVHAYPTAANESRGYLVVVVPQSPRAPHQVTARRDLRYYGRGATGNRRLTEGEIARLYERRHSWEVDRERLLEVAIAAGPGDPPDERAYLYGFAQPIPPDRALWRRAATPDSRSLLTTLLAAVRARGPRSGYDPDLRAAPMWQPRGADAWKLDTGEQDLTTGQYLGVRCELNRDGRAWLFCTRAAERTRSGVLAVMDQGIAGNLASFLSMAGAFYSAAGYHGHVDLGIALLGLQGGVSVWRTESPPRGLAYDAPSYTRTDRVNAGRLLDAQEVTGELLGDFMEAIGGEGYDPFE